MSLHNPSGTAAEASAFAQKIQSQGGRVVFTNGCFDILHPGHIHYLEEARRLGDALVLGINSDASVTRLKGPSRPILDEQARCYILSQLRSVDFVCVFQEDTPASLIQQVHPDILVKGGDYSLETIVGADYVIENGGEVHALSFVPGYSTSAIIAKIKNS